MHPDDLNALADIVADMIDHAMQESDARHKTELESLKVEFEARIKAIPAGRDGRDGVDGKDGESIVGPQGVQGERGEKGESGEDGAEGPRGEKGERGEAGQRGELGERGPAGEKGENGPAGLHGPMGDRGPQGPAGKDGRDITPAEVRAIVEEVSERHFERFGLDFERRAQDRFQRVLDNMPKPKDGRDGFGLTDFSLEHDGDGLLTFKFKSNELDKVYDVQIPFQRYRGVWREGEPYREGHSVTFASSTFTAMVDKPTEKPGTGSQWQLSVKRGKDGRDGVMKPPNDGPVKL